MASSSLRVRPATSDDSRNLFEWRNDAQTRAVSLSSDEITWPDHDRWYTASLANARRLIYIAEMQLATTSPEPVGMVRFDIDDAGQFAEVSINLNPDARGKGLGTATLVEGIRQFESDRPELQGTTAQIRDSNAPSIAIFTKAGFTKLDSVDGVGNYLRERRSSEG
jgi:RimJ/RimL family protein N-acetyltransferase